MSVRIPGYHTSKSVTLARVLVDTKAQTGYSIPEIAGIMSSFLENVALQVSMGRLVVIPGFGAFCQRVRNKDTRLSRTYPAFYPYKGFRADVRWGTPVSPEVLQKFYRYRDNNARDTSARVSSAMGSPFGIRKQFGFQRRPDDGSV